MLIYCDYRMARGQPAAHGTACHRLAQLMMQHPSAQPAASVVSRGAAALGALPACSRISNKGAGAATRQAGVLLRSGLMLALVSASSLLLSTRLSHVKILIGVCGKLLNEVNPVGWWRSGDRRAAGCLSAGVRFFRARVAGGPGARCRCACPFGMQPGPRNGFHHRTTHMRLKYWNLQLWPRSPETQLRL